MAQTTAQQQRRSIVIVMLCTLLGAAAQILFKTGANSLGTPAHGLDAVLRIVSSPVLFAGYALYGLSTILLVMALRHGQLSILNPIFALTYVWVTVLSVILFHDVMNPWKVAGLATIIGGVSVLGRSGTS